MDRILLRFRWIDARVLQCIVLMPHIECNRERMEEIMDQYNGSLRKRK